MRRKTVIALCAAALAGCSQPTPEQQLVADAASALGGSDAVLAVQTISLEGRGLLGNLGQDMTPEATGQSFTLDAYRRVIDLAGGRMRVEQTRTPTFTYFQGPAPQKQVFGIDGEVGYTVAANGSASRVPQHLERQRRAELLHHPLTLVRALLDPASTLTNLRAEGGETLADLTTGSGVSLTLAIDAASKRPTRVATRVHHANLGDVTLETRFDAYTAVGNLQLPATLTTTTDGVRTSELTFTTQTIDGEAVDLAAPADATSATPITGPPAPNVTVEEVARGIWLLAGQSHHSVLVEFADHLLLFEAPEEARTLAVIARAREQVPGKPLTRLVLSHHHFDHSGGIRAAIAEGLEIVSHAAAGAFVKDLATRSFLIAPDTLATRGGELSLQTVDDQLTFSDRTMTMHLYPIDGNPHADTLLMAYFPRERVLVEADAYSPASSYHPFAANLLENIQRRKLQVGKIVPVHGMVVPFANLVTAVKGAPSN
jgi:glyoxylase-like metal-dependent hydrolase (beta-lactamase superfamily II)